MTSEPEVVGRGSPFVQGCLVGSVVLFVVLLIAMIVLAYGRFREGTSRPDELGEGGPVSALFGSDVGLTSIPPIFTDV